MGLFRRVRDILDGDDDKKEEQAAEETSAAAEPEAAAVPSEPVIAAAVESSEGKVSGAGLNRTYTTRTGDTLEDIAAYFYGGQVQRQRLLDDNPALQLEQYGDGLPGGLVLQVGDDPNRGDTPVAGI